MAKRRREGGRGGAGKVKAEKLGQVGQMMHRVTYLAMQVTVARSSVLGRPKTWRTRFTRLWRATPQHSKAVPRLRRIQRRNWSDIGVCRRAKSDEAVLAEWELNHRKPGSIHDHCGSAVKNSPAAEHSDWSKSNFVDLLWSIISLRSITTILTIHHLIVNKMLCEGRKLVLNECRGRANKAYWAMHPIKAIFWRTHRRFLQLPVLKQKYPWLPLVANTQLYGAHWNIRRADPDNLRFARPKSRCELRMYTIAQDPGLWFWKCAGNPKI